VTRPLIILGSGPHAYEMADIVRQINALAPTWELLGCLVAEDRAGEAASCAERGLPVLGTYAEAERYGDVVFAPEYGCGAPLALLERAVSLVAPSAFVAGTAQLGGGSVVYPHCFVGHKALLGERVFVLAGSVINHDDVLEDDVTVCSGVTLAGFVHVEAECYLGQGSTIRQYLRIGRGSLIGMGSVVIADVAPNSVMVGNPAHRLRDRNPQGI